MSLHNFTAAQPHHRICIMHLCSDADTLPSIQSWNPTKSLKKANPISLSQLLGGMRDCQNKSFFADFLLPCPLVLPLPRDPKQM